MDDEDDKYEDEYIGVTSKWMTDATAVKPSDVPDTLYHYTNAAGLFGIINSQKFWMTDHRFLNDSTEFTHVKHVVEEIIFSRKSKDLTESTSSLLSSISFYQSLDDPDIGFVFSLTENGDDLGQWRTYGNDGRGFAVGFSGPSIIKQQDASKEFSLSKVSYDTEKEMRCLASALDEYESVMTALISANPNDSADIIDSAAISFNHLANTRGSINKHSSFLSEKEWRIVSYPEDDYETQVRLSGDRLVPYLVIPTRDGDSAVINRIGIGPGFKGGEIVDVVKILTRSLPNEVDIYFANTPYRRV